MPSMGGAAAPRIDGDIQQRASSAPHQLALRMRRRLVMQTAQRAGAGRDRMVVLHEVGQMHPGLFQRPPVPAFRKEPAMVVEPRRSQDQYARQRGFLNLQILST